MPRSLRFFPVNHDINADPEVWELTDKFGDRSLRVWLEILSIADRNHGELPGPWEAYPSILAGRCKSTARHLREVCEWVARWLAIDSDGVARVRNYPKYHKLRGANSPSPNLTEPNLTYKNPKKDSYRPRTKVSYPENFEITDKLKEWSLTQSFGAPESHLEAFRDYHTSRGSRFIDWDAALRSWMRNSVRFTNGGKPKQQIEGELSERTQRILRRGL